MEQICDATMKRIRYIPFEPRYIAPKFLDNKSLYSVPDETDGPNPFDFEMENLASMFLFSSGNAELAHCDDMSKIMAATAGRNVQLVWALYKKTGLDIHRFANAITGLITDGKLKIEGVAVEVQPSVTNIPLRYLSVTHTGFTLKPDHKKVIDVIADHPGCDFNTIVRFAGSTNLTRKDIGGVCFKLAKLGYLSPDASEPRRWYTWYDDPTLMQ